MTAPETPAAQHAEPAIAVERIRTALLGYRIMAWTTGLWLIALCYEIVVRYVVKVDNPPTWIGVVHGWVYFTYLLLTLNLAVKVRWPLGKTAGVLLAGTIPLLGIVVEHFQTKEIKARFGLQPVARERSAGSSRANARPRWDTASFSAGLSWAAVRSSPYGTKTGS